jgi:hypothetical protein
MLGTSGGRLLLLSTPFGRRGFFYEAWTGGDPSWERHKSVATECLRIPTSFLEEQRRLLGPRMFSQEHECEFVEATGQLFSAESIDRCFVGPDERVPILAGF